MTSILGNEWHISSLGNDVLTENGVIKDKQLVYNRALNTDIKEISQPVLREQANNEIPKIVLQIHKLRNISAPKANEDSQAAPRILKLTLTDGETYIHALEHATLDSVSFKKTPPGTKLLVEKAKMCSGYLLLTPKNCKVLGGKVESLIEKWELTRNVQINRRNNNNSEDGPPPWVNFGTKIKTANQETNFKSLTDKSKESKESSEFDQQRQDAILEATSGAVRKVFSGRVKQNVQTSAGNVKKVFEKPKKEIGRNKGKTSGRDGEGEDRPQKPSEKVSLFAFLEDKLPVSNIQDSFYQSHPSKISFTEVESVDDQKKFNYKRNKTPIPKQFEKPDYNKKTQVKAKVDNQKLQNVSNSSIEPSQKHSESTTGDSFVKPKQADPNSQSNLITDDQQRQKPQRNSNHNSNFGTNNQPRQKFTPYSQQNNNYAQQSNSHPQNYSQMSNFNTNAQHNYKSNPYSQQNNGYPQISHFNANDAYNQKYFPQTDSSFPQQNYSYNFNEKEQYKQRYPQNSPNYEQRPPRNNMEPSNFNKVDGDNHSSNNFNKRTYQKPNVPVDVNHITQDVQKMALNSQFASRSLRQHLNLGEVRRNDDGSRNRDDTSGGRMNVGDEIMAKYWEDGKYYNATIISITDRTFAVRFKGYGNIEEILKTDCHTVSPNYDDRSNFNPQYDRNNKQYSGSVEFRRRNYK